MEMANEWFHNQRSADHASPHQWLDRSSQVSLQTRQGEENVLTTLLGDRYPDSFENVINAASDLCQGPVPTSIADIDRDQVWPGGATLLDHLANLSRYPDSWPHLSAEALALLQNSRGVDLDTVANIETKEVVIGQSTAQDF